jgi:hypothetical protein
VNLKSISQLINYVLELHFFVGGVPLADVSVACRFSAIISQIELKFWFEFTFFMHLKHWSAVLVSVTRDRVGNTPQSSL